MVEVLIRIVPFSENSKFTDNGTIVPFLVNFGAGGNGDIFG